MTNYYIICRDEGRDVLSSRTFDELHEAERYRDSISPSRDPKILTSGRGWRGGCPQDQIGVAVLWLVCKRPHVFLYPEGIPWEGEGSEKDWEALYRTYVRLQDFYEGWAYWMPLDEYRLRVSTPRTRTPHPSE